MCAAANDKYNHNNCDHGFLVYKDSEHVKEGEEGRGILGSLGEFCGAFYHTPKVPPNVSNGYNMVLVPRNMVCLDPSNCPIRGDPKSEPKTAVALVKYEIDEKKFLKRYTNCHEKKVHAEEYFKCDITDDGRLSHQISENTTGKITMYITMQPCHLSTLSTRGTSPTQSCCNILNELMEKLPEGITICIKPTHLCKAGWTKRGKSKQLENEIESAEEGLKELMSNPRITFAAMMEHDWNYLWKQVNVPADLQLKVGEEREALDEYIGKMLAIWKEESQETEKQAPDVTQKVESVTASLGDLKVDKNKKVKEKKKK